MMRIKTISKSLIWLLFLAFCFDASAQQFVYLKKKNTAKTKKIRLYEKVKITSSKGIQVKGTLYSITPEVLVVEDEPFLVDDIVEIRHYDTFTGGVGRSLQYGAVLFAGVFVANSLITGVRPILTNGNLYAIGGLIVAGIILELIAIKRYDVIKKWNMEIIVIPKT